MSEEFKIVNDLTMFFCFCFYRSSSRRIKVLGLPAYRAGGRQIIPDDWNIHLPKHFFCFNCSFVFTLFIQVRLFTLFLVAEF